MGSDQSSQRSGGQRSRGKNPKRSQSVGNDNDSGHRVNKLWGNNSPRPSICSDSDIPYISYATTRPISEDPPDHKSKWEEAKARTREKHINREKRDSKAKSAGSIVIVKAASEPLTIDKDQLIRRLAEIPPFAPIIRGSLKIPWTKDPEISEKIDPMPLIRISILCEERIKRHAENVSREQVILAERISRISLDSITAALCENQKKYARTLEKLSKISELSQSLSNCHCVLNDTLESIELLNNMLPSDERLEPFVWTTG